MSSASTGEPGCISCEPEECAVAVKPRDAAMNVKRRVQISPSISPVTEQLATNSNGYTYVFGGKLSNGGTSDLAGPRSLLEIQHGRQQTRSTSISETTTDIVKIPTATPAFPGRHVHWRQCRRRPTSTSPGNPTPVTYSVIQCMYTCTEATVLSTRLTSCKPYQPL